MKGEKNMLIAILFVLDCIAFGMVIGEIISEKI
jgi:uncharacterized protein YneF (UPF0154 family)